MHITSACHRESHKVCRGRVLDPTARANQDRWSACECPCHRPSTRDETPD